MAETTEVKPLESLEGIDAAIFEEIAGKIPKTEPEPEPTVEAKAPEPTVEPVVQPAATSPKPEDTVPSWRLREVSDRARASEENARVLRDRLDTIEAHLRQAAGAEAKPPNFFEDPDGAVEAAIVKVLGPVLQNVNKQMVTMWRPIAEGIHGAEAVAEAEKAFLQAFDNKSIDPADYERIVGSNNRWDALTRWHKKQKIYADVGDNPEAWFEKRLTERFADPKFQAQVFERLRGAVTPSPTTEVRLPPTLSGDSSARRRVVNSGEMPSDADLFAAAIARPTR